MAYTIHDENETITIMSIIRSLFLIQYDSSCLLLVAVARHSGSPLTVRAL